MGRMGYTSMKRSSKAHLRLVRHLQTKSFALQVRERLAERWNLNAWGSRFGARVDTGLSIIDRVYNSCLEMMYLKC